MVACALRLIVLLGIWLAGTGQVEPARSSRTGMASGTTDAGRNDPSTGVILEHLAVYDRPDETSYRMGTLDRGERVRIRREVAGGWMAIDPPPTAVGWVARTALDLGPAPEVERSTAIARVIADGTVVRSGDYRARLPGPPWTRLPRGALVRLVDRLPLSTGQGPTATVWLAIVPPEDASCYVRSGGVTKATPPSPVLAERLASYLADDADRPGADKAALGTLPGAIRVEIERIDTMHRAILVNQPIEQWRFEAVRAGYQAILKRAGDNPAVEEALRVRLARVTRHEQAARAARTIQATLSSSRRRDGLVARTRQRLAAVDRARTRTYNAIGFIQPSAREVDGRKLHALIGSNGSTIAYLDIPPGIDLSAVGVQRVGVLGVTHYSQDLGTRLITVRDVEAIESRR